MSDRLKMSPERMIEALNNEVRLRDMEIERLRKLEQDLRYSFEKVLMDIKFIIEKNRVFDDHIYQSAFKLMTDEFMKEFNNG